MWRTDYKPDLDYALDWVDKVWGEPLMLRECVDDTEERRVIRRLRVLSPCGRHALHHRLGHCGGWLQLHSPLY